jgi:DNA polymerase III subunit delta
MTMRLLRRLEAGRRVMKLFPEKLPAPLQQGLDPVYLVAGQEPLLIEEACDADPRAARAADIAERIVIEADARFDWSQLNASTETGSLFASRRLVEVRLPTGKPGREGGAALREWAEQAGDDVLLVKCDDWEFGSEKTAWVKRPRRGRCLRAVLAGQAAPVARLDRSSPGRARAQADRAAAAFLAERLEGNLLAAAQEIERLALLFGRGQVDLEQVREAVADSARFDSFRLVELVFAGQPGAAARSIRGLREADTPMPMIVGALARELQTIGAFQALCGTCRRRALAELGVWKSRQQPLAAGRRADCSRMSCARPWPGWPISTPCPSPAASGEFWVALERLCVGLATNAARCARHEAATAIFGGTFDPVHYGHLRAAAEVSEKLDVSDFRLLPAGQPPHRDHTGAEAYHRLAMLELALAPYPDLTVDEREVRREGPSYMVETLASIRRRSRQAPVILCLGQDAANKLEGWHRWRELFDLAHLVVMKRPRSRPRYPEAVAEELKARRCAHECLMNEPAGGCATSR